MPEELERAKKVFNYLREFVQLKSKPVLEVQRWDPYVIWLHQIPDVDKWDCALRRRGERDQVADDNWITAPKLTLTPAPEPPENLAPWIASDWQNAATDSLELHAELQIPRPIEADEQAGDEIVRLADHLEIQTMLQTYRDDHWLPWREHRRKQEAANRTYAKLFTIYNQLKAMAESYELVLCQGLLTWRPDTSTSVRRHLLVSKATMEFDSKSGRLRVLASPAGAELSLEQDFLQKAAHRPSTTQTQNLQEQLKSIGSSVWDQAAVDSILKSWVNSVSPHGTYTDDYEPEPAERAKPTNPHVTLAPALILRPRAPRPIRDAIEAMQEVLEAEQGRIPGALGPFVSYGSTAANPIEDGAHHKQAGESRLYFPLPLNKEQKRISERLEGRSGVLVQGPPGTGKSHTIVNLICHLLATNRRILVTSQASRALKVIRKFFREELQAFDQLAVVLLGNDRESLSELQKSIRGLQTARSHWDPEHSSQEIRRLKQKLTAAESALAEAEREVYECRRREVEQWTVGSGCYQGSMEAIARQLREEEPQYGWLEDRPSLDQACVLTNSEATRLLHLLRDPALQSEEVLKGGAIDIERVISKESFAQWVREGSELEDADRASGAVAYLRDVPGEPEQLRESAERLEGYAVKLRRCLDFQKGWTTKIVADILGASRARWSTLARRTLEEIQVHAEAASTADEEALELPEGCSLERVFTDVQEVLRHLDAGGRWGWWIFQAPPMRGRRYIRQVRLAGRKCERIAELRDLYARVSTELTLRRLEEEWRGVREIRGATNSEKIQELRELAEQVLECVSLGEDRERIEAENPELAVHLATAWNSFVGVQSVADDLRAAERIRRRESWEQRRDQLLSSSEKQAKLDPREGLWRMVCDAVRSADLKKLERALELAEEHAVRCGLAKEREELLQKLRAAAPCLAARLAASAGDDDWEQRLEHLDRAWEWAKTKRWLDGNMAATDARRARDRAERQRKEIERVTGELAGALAWHNTMSRMTDEQVRHLVGWNDQMRKVGRGTGRYASYHRKEARRHMEHCLEAIPAWVMPLYQAAEMFPPRRETRFDVVIIDEASQASPEALFLCGLGNRLVVVGDDKQIAPYDVGINQQQAQDLLHQHLSDDPHADAYEPGQSFYGLAHRFLTQPIRLREHFRCMPEVIGFCSKEFYSDEPLIPLRQYGGDRLDPLLTKYVPDGNQSGRRYINEPEARAVVDYIVEACGKTEYAGKTFGVISLLKELQASRIEAMLQDRLGPAEMDRRQIVCGDAYAFQGDERDIILITFVVSPDQHYTSLTREEAQRRVNVAVSRAKDQLVLFHSVPLDALRRDCLRRKLLAYCDGTAKDVDQHQLGNDGWSLEDLKKWAREADRRCDNPPHPFDSWFEVDVFVRIRERGYRAIPQQTVGSYRVDIMIEGRNRRLAVECDGDIWHGPERFEEDLRRQLDLERAGLSVWRILGSEFEAQPDGAMESLWTQLKEQGIEPELEKSASGSGAEAEEVCAAEIGEVEGQVQRWDPEIPEANGSQRDVAGEADDVASVPATGEASGVAQEGVTRHVGEEEDVTDRDEAIEAVEPRGPLEEPPPSESEERPVGEQRHVRKTSGSGVWVRIDGPAEVGDRVTYCFESNDTKFVRILSAGEGGEAGLSIERPVGQALLGLCSGESAAVRTPSGDSVEVYAEAIERQQQSPHSDGGTQQATRGGEGEPREVGNVPRSNASEVVAEPYQKWRPRPLGDLGQVTVQELKALIVEGVAVEGPVVAMRLYALIREASSTRRLGRGLKAKLDQAVRIAERRREIHSEHEHPGRRNELKVLRLRGSPPVRVRQRGDRDFLDIPPSELAKVMRVKSSPGRSKEGLFRIVVNEYEVDRLTAQRRRLLEHVYRRFVRSDDQAQSR